MSEQLWLLTKPKYDVKRRLIRLEVVDSERRSMVIEVMQGMDSPLLKLEAGQALKIEGERDVN